MKHITKKVEKPMLSITLTDGKTVNNLWVLDIGQYCKLAEHSSFEFHADKSASFILEEKGNHGHKATEFHISTLAGNGNDGNLWDWIQRTMARGMAEAKKECDLEKALDRIAQRDAEGDFENAFGMCQLIAKETLEAARKEISAVA